MRTSFFSPGTEVLGMRWSDPHALLLGTIAGIRSRVPVDLHTLRKNPAAPTPSRSSIDGPAGDCAPMQALQVVAPVEH